MTTQPQPWEDARSPRRSRSGQAAAVALSIVLHGALGLFMFTHLPPPVVVPEAEAITVSLIKGPLKADAPPGPAPAAKALAAPAKKAAEKPVPEKPTPPIKLKARPTPPRPTAKPLYVSDDDAPSPAPPLPEPSAAQMAGARTAGGDGSGDGGGGGGGRQCDMVRRLQAKLREDPMVQAAVAGAHRRGGGVAKALWLWNGDWVRSPGEDGKGLSVVRQAVIWEVGFAPEACRAEPVHGLVLISMGDAPGSVRLALGAGSWRWPDLLFPPKG